MSNSQLRDIVTCIDEFRREQWLLKLKIARESGEIAVFSAINTKNAEIIEFPKQPDHTPDDAA